MIYRGSRFYDRIVASVHREVCRVTLRCMGTDRYLIVKDALCNPLSDPTYSQIVHNVRLAVKETFNGL